MSVSIQRRELQLIRPDSDTAVVRIGDETPNDKNDRGRGFILFRSYTNTHIGVIAIRKAAAWYNSYLKDNLPNQKTLPIVLLLTDDAENRRRAEKEGVPCASGR